MQEKFSKNCLLGLLVGGALSLSACVTINIYFPAAAAEKAADKIIDEVWQLKQEQEGAGKEPNKEVPPAEKPADSPAAPSK